MQVIALSRAARAARIAAELSRRLSVPVDVVPQGRLFAVRAGHFDGPAAAGQLKGAIAVLSEEYAGAFVVADSLLAPDAPRAAAAGGFTNGRNCAIFTGSSSAVRHSHW